MNPYLRLLFKSVAVFMGAVSVTKGQFAVTGQINLFDWLALLWPGALAVAAYWGGVADSTPAPWKEEAKP